MNKNTVMNIETLIDVKLVQMFEESKTESLKADDINALAGLISVLLEIEKCERLTDLLSDTPKQHELN